MSIDTTEIRKKQSTKIEGRSKRIAVLSIIVGISGSVLILAGGLGLIGNSVLSFLLSGLGLFSELSVFATNLAAIALGLSLLGTAVGLWYLKMWALAVGLTVSLVQIIISASTLNFTSFEFIRGVIVFALLVRFNGYFRRMDEGLANPVIC